MGGYYDTSLSAERLKRCYDLATPRVRRYLEAEVEQTLASVAKRRRVLELGCGYGRVLGRLREVVDIAVGIDTSLDSLLLARRDLGGGVELALMDATALGFAGGGFDAVVCVQNGLSAFHADARRVVAEALRVAAPGGRLVFSSYARRFWEHRLEWFRVQSRAGLVGEIDEGATADGEIVCKDGFTATTTDPAEFLSLFEPHGVTPSIVEVDGSSVFCVVDVTA